MEFIATTKIESANNQFRGSMYLHLEDGRSISFIRNYDAGRWEFEDYQENDITLSFPSSGGFLITHRDERKDLFPVRRLSPAIHGR